MEKRIFNLSLDDMSPHPKAGLGFEPIEWCNNLIVKYPDIKINLFVPAAYCRLKEKPCLLSKNMKWVEKLKRLPEKNYRINLHGYYHRRVHRKKHKNSNNDEWQLLDRLEASKLSQNMMSEFARVGLTKDKKFRPTFRPPGWKISANSVIALQKNGVKCFAGIEQYHNRVKKHVNVKWINANWHMTEPCVVKGNIIACGHTSRWSKNYMDKKRYALIDELLSKEEFVFKFIEDV